ncbi:MAG TPA: GerMN domain-containing protein [Thermoanaerobaculia bacterium]|nr:GerMN domain-containing protein [Thermoanaerobaculia bacterium]
MSPRSMRAAAMAALLLLPACRGKEQRAASPADAVNRVTTRAVVLYFERADGLLAPEMREMPLPESEAAAIHPLLSALLAGSKNAALPKPFPDGTIVRGAFVLPEGTAVVDLGGREIQEGWQTGSHAELAAAYAIVQTVVANLSSVRRVQILVGGEVAPTLAGHLDLTRPLRPHPDLVAGPAGREASPAAPPAAPPTTAPPAAKP